ncbi:MAG: M20/M25/M40 family metallo-hydrolase [Chloroflexi bacterium]|nr:M20/M25/M40 family metallo-hydrolase [Chloroflexota bacterium]
MEYGALFAALKELTDIPGTSGYEHEVVRYLVDRMRPLADRVEVDALGNVYAVVDGRAPELRVICPAHSDAVGLFVKHVEPNGALRVGGVGATPAYLAYGQRVVVDAVPQAVYGVVGTWPGHMGFDGQSHVPSSHDQLFVDVGADSAADVAAMGIRPGQQVTFDRPLVYLGDPAKGVVSGRALDNRAGCLVLLETLRALRESRAAVEPTVYLVACSQEEVGLRGAAVAGPHVQAHVCIGVDGTISAAGAGSAADPGAIARAAVPTVLGGGVGISFYDMSATRARGLIANPKLNQWLIDVAQRHAIPFQYEGHIPYITSDASAVQLAGRGGCPSTTLKVPTRYTHGPVETCHLGDIASAIRLLTEALRAITPGLDLSVG